jgi:hypothetical protein
VCAHRTMASREGRNFRPRVADTDGDGDVGSPFPTPTALHAGEGPLLPRQLTSIVMPFRAAWGMRLTAVSWKVAPS